MPEADTPVMTTSPTHAADVSDASAATLIKRHSLTTRVWHWVNALALLVLLMSGLQIFNAHPALYWGSSSHFDQPILAIGARMSPNGPMGFTDIAGHRFTTTGVLGWSSVDGQMQARAFPAWITLPGAQWLSLGRQWHFAGAWVFGVLLIVYLLYSLISRRRRRTITPQRREWRRIPQTISEHLRLRLPRVRDYNIIQKLTYLIVLFILLPLMILTGLALSPTMDTAWPWLTPLFDGHQSARTIHFIGALSLVAFFVIHILMVLISGLFNNLRSMLTGGYRIGQATPDPDETGQS